MTLVLYLAMCSGRVLLINSPYPSPLENFLEPNEIFWNATISGVVEDLPTLDVMDVRNHDLVVDASVMGYNLGRCNGSPPRHTLKTMWSNQCMSNYFKEKEMAFPYAGHIPEQRLLRWSFWSLFKFSDAVIARATELKHNANLPLGTNGFDDYAAIHLRTGDRSMGIKNAKQGKFSRIRHMLDQQDKYLDCYHKFQEAVPDLNIAYIASDSLEAKQRFNTWDDSIHFADDTNIYHVDEANRIEGAEITIGDDRSYQGSLDGWAELAVLIDSKCLVMSWSMFSFAAHYIRGENLCGIYFGDCHNTTVALNDPHEYSYEAGKTPMTRIS